MASLPCAICGCAYLPTKPLDGVQGRLWDSDWCPSCMQLNFEGSQDQEPGPHPSDDPLPASARLSLAAYVRQPITARQRRAIDRLTQRWAEEEGLL